MDLCKLDTSLNMAEEPLCGVAIALGNSHSHLTPTPVPQLRPQGHRPSQLPLILSKLYLLSGWPQDGFNFSLPRLLRHLYSATWRWQARVGRIHSIFCVSSKASAPGYFWTAERWSASRREGGARPGTPSRRQTNRSRSRVRETSSPGPECNLSAKMAK